MTIQNQTRFYMNFFSCNDRYYRLPNYWPFLVNHPVYQELLMYSWSKLQIYYKNILLSKICPVAGIFNTLTFRGPCIVMYYCNKIKEMH